MSFTLSKETPIEAYELLDCWLDGEKILKTSELPDSNMNQVLRIHTDKRTVIAKQSRDYVRKFPQIPAPIGRIETEKRFFELVQQNRHLSQYSPKIIAWYPESFLLITEDLGESGDFSGIYTHKKSLGESEIEQLIDYLNVLHTLSPSDFPSNLEMRKLNHEHLFNFPFQINNGLDLDSIQVGLQNLSLAFKEDQPLKEKIKDLGKRYLTTGKSLLHGDFYPGSWMDSSSGVKIIDPEFSFVGDREFDLGVFLAHADFAGIGNKIEKTIKMKYQNSIDEKLIQAFRGVEIMRRLIGIAQLPIDLNLSQKQQLLEKAKKLILDL